MTTSIHVNVTLAVDKAGNPYPIYSAADMITAQCLDTKTGDIVLTKLPTPTDNPVVINFSLLTAHLELGAKETEVKFCFDTDNPDANIDIRRWTAAKRLRVVIPKRKRGRILSNPPVFGSTRATARTIQITDSNNDQKTYQYTLWVTSDLNGTPWFKLDPRIKNQ